MRTVNLKNMHLDQLISTFDHGLRTVFAKAHTERHYPAALMDEAALSPQEKAQAAALMRINHVGEVCAQALYNGQAATCQNPKIISALQQAAQEETEHLAWCERRIEELGGRKSVLNPVWYGASFALGALAGKVGDQWNLGFLAETEQQVSAHLASHLQKLSVDDVKTRAIIEQMQLDETSHAHEAKALGAAALPESVKTGMKLASKIMTTTAYYV